MTTGQTLSEPVSDLSADEQRAAITAAAEHLISAKRLLVLIGAGGSADAGVPTFRDVGGLWQTQRPEDLAHPTAFAAQPEVVWDWYRSRRTEILAAVPHAGQRALALLQRHFRAAQVLMATTNEDDLLERAGVSDVRHLHGAIFTTACSAHCGWAVEDRESRRAGRTCPDCGALTRPGSVWFGEAVPPAPLEEIAALEPDGCLVIGSSCEVAPVSQIPLELALAGVPVVEVNVHATPLSAHALLLRGTALEILPRLVDLLTSSTMRDQRHRTES